MQQEKNQKEQPTTPFSKEDLLGKQEQSEPAEQESDDPGTTEADNETEDDD